MPTLVDEVAAPWKEDDVLSPDKRGRFSAALDEEEEEDDAGKGTSNRPSIACMRNE